MVEDGSIDTSKLALPPAIDRDFREFCGGLIDTLGPGLVSITVYGSAARREFFPEASDVNVLIVLEDASLEALRPALEVVARGRKRARVTPFFLTRADIDTSTDVFPIKFHDMRDAYVVVHGADCLTTLTISDANMRLEVEQELKMLVISLREFGLHWGLHGGTAGGEHVLVYFNNLLFLLRRLLGLEGVQVSGKSEEVIDAAAARYGIDAPAMRRLLSQKRGAEPLRDAWAGAVALYHAVAKAADVADKLVIA